MLCLSDASIPTGLLLRQCQDRRHSVTMQTLCASGRLPKLKGAK